MLQPTSLRLNSRFWHQPRLCVVGFVPECTESVSRMKPMPSFMTHLANPFRLCEHLVQRREKVASLNPRPALQQQKQMEHDSPPRSHPTRKTLLALFSSCPPDNGVPFCCQPLNMFEQPSCRSTGLCLCFQSDALLENMHRQCLPLGHSLKWQLCQKCQHVVARCLQKV